MSGLLFEPEQFRIRRLQVFRWGTFADLVDIPIASRGFLFVGRSGSGKSTLLDAFSALLIPPKWLDFNAAARETERSGRDRNLLSYVRGAWAEQKEEVSGEIVTRYLRPGSTWSALALTLADNQGRVVILVRLFWIKGNSNSNSEVKQSFLIFERPFDLEELSDFDTDIRRLKLQFPEAFLADSFPRYCERFRRLLGIENDLALRLLHKTQSAKNLGDLNVFLRDFMLDRPATFEAAERLVNEFAELSAAHQSVVTAREQVETLRPARDSHGRLLELRAEETSLAELLAGMDSHRENLRLRLVQERLEALRVEARGLEDETQRQESRLGQARAHLRDLEQQHRDLGGDQLERWEEEQRSLELQQRQRLSKRSLAEEACRRLHWGLAQEPRAFAEQVGQARQELEQYQQQSELQEQEKLQLHSQKDEVSREFAATRREVEALRRQPSNIPADMLDLRARVADALQLNEAALPFVGELLEVKPQESGWQGAVERVLHNFALSLLVDERHYRVLSAHVNNTHLGGRLVYYRVNKPEIFTGRPPAAHSLVNKLNLKAGNFEPWLLSELRRRFDYACVDSMTAFQQAEQALTRQGQTRGKARHEKDDRHSIEDRRHWVLGFDNREKLALCERQAQEQALAIARLQKQIDQLSADQRERHERSRHCQTLVNMQWQEIDVATLLDRLRTLERLLEETRRGNTALAEIAQRIAAQVGVVEAAERSLAEAKAEQIRNVKEATDMENRRSRLEADPCRVALTAHQRQGLEARFGQFKRTPTLNNLDDLARSVDRSLSADKERVLAEKHTVEESIRNLFASFKRTWPEDSADLDTSLASAPDFFAKLQRLETDNLPAFEEKFFDLLQKQSRENLTSLSSYLNMERKAILQRMELVNESMREAAFNPGTYLHIQVSDRQLAEVREFKQEMEAILSHSWSADREEAEKRFLGLRRLVERLASLDADKRRWREAVLDVRLHVEFIGRELDEDDNEIEVYRSGAGKSGGQRQKLATTCLAAALRYQLGGSEQHWPIYAPVILDEAFDKADNEFTTLAMNIFKNFGFQMIVATPLKAVMTLEPFIGGACFVDISERNCSSIFLIEYDESRQRLRLPDLSAEGAFALS